MRKKQYHSARRRLDSRAYTMAEMLLVVGLLAILLAVGAVGASQMMRQGRQAALDKMAETLYIAVQRNLTNAKLSGETVDKTLYSAYETDYVRTKLEFDGVTIHPIEDTNAVPPDYKLTSKQVEEHQANAEKLRDFLFRDTVSAEIRDANWIIRFDLDSYSVLDVYFSQKESAQTDYFNNDVSRMSDEELFSDLSGEDADKASLKRVQTRLQRALIGYYGGDGTDDRPVDMSWFANMPSGNEEPPPTERPTYTGESTPPPGMPSGGGNSGNTGGGGVDTPSTPGNTDSSDTTPHAPVKPADSENSQGGSGTSEGGTGGTGEGSSEEGGSGGTGSGDSEEGGSGGTGSGGTGSGDSEEGGSGGDNPTNEPDDPENDENLLKPEDTVTKSTPTSNPEKESNIAHKLYYWIGYDDNQDEPIVNAEKLVTRLNCWVPQSAVFNAGTGPVNVRFTLTVRGISSGQIQRFYYRMDPFGFYSRRNDNGIYTDFVSGKVCQEAERRVTDSVTNSPTSVSGWLYSYTVILDSLLDTDGDKVTLDKDKRFQSRFPGFIPGEDLMLGFEVDLDSEDLKKEARRAAFAALSDEEKSAYGFANMTELDDTTAETADWLWKVYMPGWNEYPICNSLFANVGYDAGGHYASPVDSAGNYTAKIAYGRHLQNLDTTISGIAKDGTLQQIESYHNATNHTNITATAIHAVQKQSIDFLNGQDTRYQRWNSKNAYGGDYRSNNRPYTFTPINNDKLIKYNGNGHTIENLQVNLTAGTETQKVYSIGLGEHTEAKLSARLEKTNGAGLFDTLTGDVTLSNLTLKDPVITAAQGMNVGAFAGKTTAAENGHLTLENLTLGSVSQTSGPPEIHAPNALNVGGVIGWAQVPVTIRRPEGAADTVKALTVDWARYNIDIPGAANVGGVIGQATEAVHATTGGLTLNNLTLDNKTRDTSDTTARTIGGVIGLAGNDVTLSGVEMVNPKLVGGISTTVGGLVGKASGENSQVTISSGRLYMSESSYSDANTKLDTVLNQWLVGGQYAGGLIGYAAGNVSIGKAADGVPSFAATVVNANATGTTYAGGLAGAVDGTLTVDYAWADCYVKSNGNTAAYIGGLAGRCGAESEFRHCYAAGFVVSNTRTFPAITETDPVQRQAKIAQELNKDANKQPLTVAGFAPCTVATISDAYSVFNYDDPTIGITGIVTGQYKGQPAVLKLAKKYKLAAAGMVSEAYYAYGGEALIDGVGRSIDRDTLKLKQIPGFVPNEENKTSNGIDKDKTKLYTLFHDELERDGVEPGKEQEPPRYPYPVLSVAVPEGQTLTHYNDFLVTNPKKLISVTIDRSRETELKAALSGVADTDRNEVIANYLSHSTNAEPHSEDEILEKDKQGDDNTKWHLVTSTTDSRRANGERFVGWFTKEEFFNYKRSLVQSGFSFTPVQYWTGTGTDPFNNDSIFYTNTTAFSAHLGQNSNLIFPKKADGTEVRELYAVYEHLDPFLVTVENRYYNASRMNAALVGIIIEACKENSASPLKDIALTFYEVNSAGEYQYEGGTRKMVPLSYASATATEKSRLYNFKAKYLTDSYNEKGHSILEEFAGNETLMGILNSPGTSSVNWSAEIEPDVTLNDLMKEAFAGSHLSQPQSIPIDTTAPEYNPAKTKNYTFVPFGIQVAANREGSKNVDLPLRKAEYCARFDENGKFLGFCQINPVGEIERQGTTPETYKIKNLPASGDLNQDAVNGYLGGDVTFTKDNVTFGQAAIKLDRKSTYVALYDDIPFDLDVELEFGNTDAGSAGNVFKPGEGQDTVWSDPNDLKAALSAARTALENNATATVKITGSLGTTVLNKLDQLTFEGFTLNEKLTKTSIILANGTNETKVYYDRNRNTLSYDFDGGVYYAPSGDDVVTKSFRASNSYYEDNAEKQDPGGVFYGQTLGAYLPTAAQNNDKYPNTARRNGYDFDGWDFYLSGAETPYATLTTDNVLVDSDGYLLDSIGKVDQSLRVQADANQVVTPQRAGDYILTRQAKQATETESSWITLDLFSTGNVSKTWKKNGQSYEERAIKWSDISGQDYSKILVYHAVLHYNGDTEWIPTTLDKVLVTRETLKMPDFDVTAKVRWTPKTRLNVRMEIYIQRQTDDWRWNTNAETPGDLPATGETVTGYELGSDVRNKGSEDNYNNSARHRLYDFYQSYEIGEQDAETYEEGSTNAGKLTNKDQYQGLMYDFFTKACEKNSSFDNTNKDYLYSYVQNNPNNGKVKCKMLYLNPGVSTVDDSSGDIVYRLYLDREVVTFKWVGKVYVERYFDYSQWKWISAHYEYPFIGQIYGIYEEPLDNTVAGIKREFNTNFTWNPYLIQANRTSRDEENTPPSMSSATLTTLDSFSYTLRWDTATTDSPGVYFVGTNSTENYTKQLLYWRENNDNDRDTKLRDLAMGIEPKSETENYDFADTDVTAKVINSVVEQSILYGTTSPYRISKENAISYWGTVKTGDSVCSPLPDGNFNLNEKLSGYHLVGYESTADNISDSSSTTIYSAIFDSTNYEGTYDKYGKVSAGVGSSGLTVYNARNWHKVTFADIAYGPDKQYDELLDAYFYGAELTRLPDINSDNEALYRPERYGNEYEFGGWFTGRDGSGTQLKFTADERDLLQALTKEGDPLYTQEYANREGLALKQNRVTHKWLTGSGSGYTMGDADVTVFAYWKRKTVKVSFDINYPLTQFDIAAPGENAPETTISGKTGTVLTSKATDKGGFTPYTVAQLETPAPQDVQMGTSPALPTPGKSIGATSEGYNAALSDTGFLWSVYPSSTAEGSAEHTLSGAVYKYTTDSEVDAKYKEGGEKATKLLKVRFVTQNHNGEDILYTTKDDHGNDVYFYVYYKWAGWYTFTPPSTDMKPTQENLEKYGSPVGENDVVMRAQTLYGKWEPVAGKTDYYVDCYLDTQEGETEDIVKIHLYKNIGDTGTMSPPLPEQADAETDPVIAAQYRRLEGYYPVSDLIPYEITPGYEFKFHYVKGDRWQYRIREHVKFTGGGDGEVEILLPSKSVATMSPQIQLSASLNTYKLTEYWLGLADVENVTLSKKTGTDGEGHDTFEFYSYEPGVVPVAAQQGGEKQTSFVEPPKITNPRGTPTEATYEGSIEADGQTFDGKRVTVTEKGRIVDIYYENRPEEVPAVADVEYMSGTDYLAPLRRGSGIPALVSGTSGGVTYYTTLTMVYKVQPAKEGAPQGTDQTVTLIAGQNAPDVTIDPGDYKVTATLKLLQQNGETANPEADTQKGIWTSPLPEATVRVRN